MAKKIVLVLFVLAGLGISGCASYSTRDRVVTPLGLFTPASVNQSREVVAEYAVILGLVTDGYEEFLDATKGLEIDIIDTNYLFLYRKVQAVRRN
jgi:hypothetical protein